MWFLLLALLLQTAQPRATVVCAVVSDDKPVAGAEVVVSGQTYVTAANGEVRIDVAAGAVTITAAKEGFAPLTTSVSVAAGQEQRVTIELERAPTVSEVVTVSATRTDTRLADEPMHVEVLDREDLEEEQSQTPGDVVMVLNEKSGIHVQATAPGLGAATIRIQGMRGRYTRVLADGLPLFGEDVGGLSLMQTPPADLGRIEIIKGVASALYGGGALGGVIDLISRRPGPKPDRQILLNRSSGGATDTVLFAEQPMSSMWSGSILAGGHWQENRDVDGDGWADVAGYSRGVARPRLFWDNHAGTSGYATVGAMSERRTGGTVPGRVLPATGTSYFESLETARFDAGVVAQTMVAGKYVLTARGSATHERHERTIESATQHDTGQTLFGELALRGTARAQTWVAGGAFERTVFDPHEEPQFAARYNVPAVFGEDTIVVRRWLSVSASGRIDFHNVFGTFASPRVSALFRGGNWTARMSAGTGFYAPTANSEETQAAGLTGLKIPAPLQPERGRSESVDVTRTAGPVSITASVFHSVIDDPVVLDRATYSLRNLATSTDNTGGELLAVWHKEPFTITTTYTYVDSHEGDAPDRGEVPLTPRHSVGVFGSWDDEDWGRVTLEWFYTGEQQLEDNPYRATSVPYRVFGALVEKRLRHVILFVNGENLADVRQTRWDPLIRPQPSASGQWTVDGWSPLDGRVINAGVRLMF